jgi:hypothetical protein
MNDLEVDKPFFLEFIGYKVIINSISPFTFHKLSLQIIIAKLSFKPQRKMMKKIFFVLIVLITVSAIISSCSPSRSRSSCPMTEGIIH